MNCTHKQGYKFRLIERQVKSMKDLTLITLDDIINRLVVISQNQKKIMDKLGIEDEEKED